MRAALPTARVQELPRVRQRQLPKHFALRMAYKHTQGSQDPVLSPTKKCIHLRTARQSVIRQLRAQHAHHRALRVVPARPQVSVAAMSLRGA
mmetsp:Transcript_6521/g.15480  ORF Transcript_6521/g.15480 Transcript_6521/m.15480 type:complete len:92 (-) Transcript_6521:170-445(-)